MDKMIMHPSMSRGATCEYGCCDEAKGHKGAKPIRRRLKRSQRQIWQAEIRRETARLRAELDN